MTPPSFWIARATFIIETITDGLTFRLESMYVPLHRLRVLALEQNTGVK